MGFLALIFATEAAMLRKMRSRTLLGLGVALAAGASLPALASAATITVNDTEDSNSFGAVGCTLRDAVTAANTNAPHAECNGDTAGADTIVIAGGLTYDLFNIGVPDDTNANGDLDITGPLTITTSGAGLATIGGNDNGANPLANRDRVIHVHATAGQVTLQSVRVQDGHVQSATGVPGGGGILSDARLTISNSEITGNRVQVNEAPQTRGGGIYVRGPLGSLTMSGSTVTGNVVQVQGTVGTDRQGIGGGVFVYGSGSSAAITNSTVSGNIAFGASGVGPGLVGGIFLGDFSPNTPSPVTLTNNTVTQNLASLGGAITGGLQVAAGTMTGNIVAGNTSDSALYPDCNGDPVSGGANVIGNRGTNLDCEITGPGDLAGTPDSPVVANLGTLLPNGGLTRTHLPNAGSPAINRGGTCPATDQRGLFRYAGGACDSGSVEVGATSTPPPTTTTPTPPAPPAPKKKCKKKKKQGKGVAAAKKCKKNKKKK
jgi:putative cofactor-binding repeat protein